MNISNYLFNAFSQAPIVEEEQSPSYVPFVAGTCVAASIYYIHSQLDPQVQERIQNRIKEASATVLDVAEVLLVSTCLVTQVFFEQLSKKETRAATKAQETPQSAALENAELASKKPSLEAFLKPSEESSEEDPLQAQLFNRIEEFSARTGKELDEEFLLTLVQYFFEPSTSLCLQSDTLTELPDFFDLLPSVQELTLVMPKLQSLPASLLEAKNLTKLQMIECNKLHGVSLAQMRSLKASVAKPKSEVISDCYSPVGASKTLSSYCHLKNPSDSQVGMTAGLAECFFDCEGVRTNRKKHFALESLYLKEGKVQVLKATPKDESSPNAVLKVFTSSNKASRIFTKLSTMQEKMGASALGHLALPKGLLEGQDLQLHGSGSSALIFEHYNLGDMQDLVAGQNPQSLSFSLREKQSIAKDVLLSLAACHEEGIVHHDIKPANLFVRRKEQVEGAIGDWDGFITKTSIDQYIKKCLSELIYNHSKEFNKQVGEDKKRLFDEKILPKLANELFDRFPRTSRFVPSSSRESLLKHLKKSPEILKVKNRLNHPHELTVTQLAKICDWSNLIDVIFENKKVFDTAALAISLIIFFLDGNLTSQTFSDNPVIALQDGVLFIPDTKSLKIALTLKGLSSAQSDALIHLAQPFSKAPSEMTSGRKLVELSNLFSL